MTHHENSPRGACKDFEQDLVLYYYGECGGTERSRVETHLKDCAPCRHFLEDLHTLLPLTVKPDYPPQPFWESYSREVQRKLRAAEEKASWWRGLFSFFRPWPVPALATALVLVLALTLTFTKDMWRSQEPPPEELALLEVLPVAEDLEFFKAMEFLDAMDLLEAVGGPKNGSA